MRSLKKCILIGISFLAFSTCKTARNEASSVESSANINRYECAFKGYVDEYSHDGGYEDGVTVVMQSNRPTLIDAKGNKHILERTDKKSFRGYDEIWASKDFDYNDNTGVLFERKRTSPEIAGALVGTDGGVRPSRLARFDCRPQKN